MTAILEERAEQVKLRLTAERDQDIEVKEDGEEEGLDFEPQDSDLELEEDSSEENTKEEQALQRHL